MTHVLNNGRFNEFLILIGYLTLKPGSGVAFTVQNDPIHFGKPVIVPIAIPGVIVGVLMVIVRDADQARDAMQSVFDFQLNVGRLGHAVWLQKFDYRSITILVKLIKHASDPALMTLDRDLAMLGCRTAARTKPSSRSHTSMMTSVEQIGFHTILKVNTQYKLKSISQSSVWS